MATTGTMIDQYHDLREEKRRHEEAIKGITEKMSRLETDLLLQMEAEGITKATGKTATISVGEQIRPNVQDWDQFYSFIHKNKYYHLLERRPSVGGCQELFETKGKIPGVVPFVAKRINMRNL